MKRAFTLIELLVVIAIVAILTAILFPVFAQSKMTAKKTQSISQIRQFGMAWLLYNSDYDDTVMRAAIESGGKTFYWWGSWNGSELREREGLLFPYLRDTRIQVDPVFPNELRTALRLTGYGYNYAYLSPSDYPPPLYEEVAIPVRASQIEAASETLLFAGAARINNWSYSVPTLEGNTYIDPPSYDFPGVHGRYALHAVLSWTDGHVSSARPALRSLDFGYGHSADVFRKHNVGDILEQGCPVDSACEDYYYALSKP